MASLFWTKWPKCVTEHPKRNVCAALAHVTCMLLHAPRAPRMRPPSHTPRHPACKCGSPPMPWPPHMHCRDPKISWPPGDTCASTAELNWGNGSRASRDGAACHLWHTCHRFAITGSQLRKLKLPKELLIQFYRGIIESVICTSITVWFGSATQQDKHRLQRIIRTAEKTISTNLLSIEDLYTARVKKTAVKIFTDPSHPGHKLFQLLPSK
ncbi:uncharacterized protein LOC131194757 [Ahaetulla prasina]|uniref:uncharacterized protein LOC131194757 n=1 Tax=Ahaetulla prasina TaxID=499056 RepID=UPI00264914A3|nr:uncharacterized protein LOC131194757 [Ahaetulla prasina]